MNLYWIVLLAILLPVVCTAQTAEDRYAEAGQKALAAGDYAAARSNFENLAKLQPDVAEVHANLAVTDFKLRDYAQAVQQIRDAKKLKPSLSNLDSLLGMSLAELGRYEEALPSLEDGFSKAPNQHTQRMCGLQLMRAYTGLHRDTDAVGIALDLDRLYPDDPEILYNTSRIYGNFAYLTLHKLAEVAPSSIWRHQAAAEAFESQGATQSAVGEYQEVLRLDPSRPGIHYRIGRTLLAQKNHQPDDRANAAKEFEQELRINPAEANALYELAELRRQANELDKAQELFEAALKQYSDFQQAQVGLASVLMAKHQPDRALPHLRRAVTLDAEDEVAWYRLSQADRALGNTEEQIKAMAEFKRLHTVQKNAELSTEVTRQTLPDGENH